MCRITIIVIFIISFFIINDSNDGAEYWVPCPFYPTIQSAIDHADINDNHVIHVFSGTYFENIDFKGKKIYLVSDEGAALTTIDGCGIPQAESVVTINTLETQSSVLDGFTITNGFGKSEGNVTFGGGIYIRDACPIIKNCIIIDNEADYGGGIYVDGDNPDPGIPYPNDTPLSDNNIIENNVAYKNGGGICLIDCSPEIRGGLIQGNTAITADRDYGYGGGIYVDGEDYNNQESYSYPWIVQLTIKSNIASMGGGGICCYRSSAVVDNVTIEYNEASIDYPDPPDPKDRYAHGGGIYCFGPMIDYGQNVKATPCISNNTIRHNHADIGGGLCDRYNSAALFLRNQVHNNTSSGEGGGISVNKFCETEITNNDIYDNITLPVGGVEPGEQMSRGGGIRLTSTSAVVKDNNINNNQATRGGGVYIINLRLVDFSIDLENNSISGNQAEQGGGVYVETAGDLVKLTNNLIIINEAKDLGHYWGNHGQINGGGICCGDTPLEIDNNTIASNISEIAGGGIFCRYNTGFEIKNSIIYFNQIGVDPNYTFDQIDFDNYTRWEYSPHLYFCCIQDGWVEGNGSDNILDDPEFAEDIYEDKYYLSQIDAGQSIDSPCFDAGDPSSTGITGTTRTDYEQDVGIVDIGYHYPLRQQ